MRTLNANIPTSLGDIINIKAHLDSVKHNYDQINLTYHINLWKEALEIDNKKEQEWRQYLDELSVLFFSQPPYRMNCGEYKFYTTEDLLKEFNIQPIQADLAHLLCCGKSLDIKDYVVITTKIRGINCYDFIPKFTEIWAALNKTSCKIVILGEREVEMRKEYYNPLIINTIFGIYNEIISNLPADRIIDMTVSALGNSQSNLKQIQQDCLIMKEAKAVIALGIGGNVCMSNAVTNKIIGYREDNMWLADHIFPKSCITKNWTEFIKKLEVL